MKHWPSQCPKATLSTVDEATLLEILLRGGDRLLLGCVYRSSTSPDVNNVAINKLIYTIRNGSYSHVCPVGDFNAPHINWDLQITSGFDHSFESKFIKTIQDCFLYQHVDQPTRFWGTDAPSLLDLILTNEEYVMLGIPMSRTSWGKWSCTINIKIPLSLRIPASKEKDLPVQ